DLQAGDDPWRPKDITTELKDQFGDRVTITAIPGASHSLFPEQPRAVVDAIATWARRLFG
ncbi:MAG TPA: alpha/beta hydrolase, partial [Pseudonocardia sp.]|uniref:alpha/beta fold hydrolase n=1 Tax=Pseudonocardia sp. TaxID=60912 RepID=UPI002EDB8E74